jgi:hypothetical protein
LHQPDVGSVVAASGALNLYGGHRVELLLFSAYDSHICLGLCSMNFPLRIVGWVSFLTPHFVQVNNSNVGFLSGFLLVLVLNRILSKIPYYTSP